MKDFNIGEMVVEIHDGVFHDFGPVISVDPSTVTLLNVDGNQVTVDIMSVYSLGHLYSIEMRREFAAGDAVCVVSGEAYYPRRGVVSSVSDSDNIITVTIDGIDMDFGNIVVFHYKAVN